MVIRVRGVELDGRTQTIQHAGLTHQFERRQQPTNIWKVFVSLVCGGGLTAGELVDVVHAESPDGGPEWALGNIGKQIMSIRRLCTKLELKMIAVRCGETANRYEIIPAWMERGSR